MFPERVDEHINQLSPDLALVTCCILLLFLFMYVSYLPNLPVSFWTARTEAQRTAGLHFSLPYVTIGHEVGTLPPTGPQRIQAEVKEGAALIQPQPCRHVLNQSSSRSSAPLLSQYSLTGGKEGAVIVRGVLPLDPSSMRYRPILQAPPCPPCRAGVRTGRANY